MNGASLRQNSTSEHLAIVAPLSNAMREVALEEGSILKKRMVKYLSTLEDPRREKILDFYIQYRNSITQAKGSQVRHQAWPGGYRDHLAECFRIAEVGFEALGRIRPLPFSFASVVVVLFFHDVEKIWKYTNGLPEGFDKDHFYDVTLKNSFGIEFSDEERNALRYVHGESDAEYSPTERKAGPLAAFCHLADMGSARLWPLEGHGLG